MPGTCGEDHSLSFDAEVNVSTHQSVRGMRGGRILTSSTAATRFEVSTALLRSFRAGTEWSGQTALAKARHGRFHDKECKHDC